MKKFILTLLILVPFAIKAQVTLIPDPVFESKLLQLGIDSDGVVNGQILTVDAQTPTQIYLGGGSIIQNLTGLEAFINLEYIEGYGNAVGNTMNLTTLTKLKTLIFSNNWLSSLDLSSNKDLETLIVGNGDYEIFQYNHLTTLDLSNNNKLKLLSVYSLLSLWKINLKNHNAPNLKIILGDENNDPYNVCIEVDDPVAATNGTAPYDTWNITNTQNGSHYFNQNCALSVEKFVNQNFKIYPNPATDYVAVEQTTTEGVHLQAVQILDSSGKLVRSVNENFDQINVSNLNKGLYLFVIQTDKGNKTEKIIVQ
ncbi:T9SS type A sorting domain-containing protein [Flavobacterium sp. CBA20B-1]|uniref:T9SS type A sorting domain-containing protein n=1 Tax=unclassified Flavobacterium TaxID=196869 RepID=UPI002225B52A|nr:MULTISPECIES: T9SS type A sorting domain-containing protein [unclassified Flavobacterium]WCM41585.1 T9SS type A sorting domain-containing protein [Flavobacterium sp. CBA20B-1]